MTNKVNKNLSDQDFKSKNKELIRLQKYLAKCGIASRRHSEKLIANKRVTVNGNIITKQGCKINPKTDKVMVDRKNVLPSKNSITLILNKPAGYISTMNDPQGRPCVANLIPKEKYPNLFPVGRLDRLTSGLLIFTTEGDLGQALLHPKNEVSKKYIAIINGNLSKNSKAYKQLSEGVNIKGGKTRPAKVRILEKFDFSKYQILEKDFFNGCAKNNDIDCMPHTEKLLNSTFTKVLIEIHEGKNRQVRRMFAALGYEVLLLTRVSIGNIKLDGLEIGKWRKIYIDIDKVNIDNKR